MENEQEIIVVDHTGEDFENDEQDISEWKIYAEVLVLCVVISFFAIMISSMYVLYLESVLLSAPRFH